MASLDIFQRRFIERLDRPWDLGLLFDYLPDTYFYAKNLRGQFVMVNQALATMFGACTPEEMVGQTDHDFSPHDLADQYVAEDRRVIRDPPAGDPPAVADPRPPRHVEMVSFEQDSAVRQGGQSDWDRRRNAQRGEGQRAVGALPGDGGRFEPSVNAIRGEDRLSSFGPVGAAVDQPVRPPLQTLVPTHAATVFAARPAERGLPDARLDGPERLANRAPHRFLRPKLFHQAFSPSDGHDAHGLPAEIPPGTVSADERSAAARRDSPRSLLRADDLS